MKVAVVGANGFVGTLLCRHFAALDIEAVPVSTRGVGFDGVTGLLHDLDIEPLRAAVYLAQSPHYREVPKHAAHLWSVNVLSAIKAAEWARRCGADRFVYASSGNVYQPSFDALAENAELRRDNWYALSKVQAEEALQLFGEFPSVTCARLFGVYGPQQRGRLVPNLIRAVSTGEDIRLQAHSSDAADEEGFRLSLTYVDDAVSILGHFALNPSPPIVNVAAPQAWSIKQIASEIGQLVGKAPKFSVDATPREGDLVADTQRLRALWPRDFVPLRDGLTKTIAADRTPRPEHSCL